MSLFRKPSELEVTPTLTAMIYGQPGTGKSTLACSAPNAVLFDFDGGASRLYGGHRVTTLQVRSWEQVVEAMEELRTNPELSWVKSIVIDTAGKMLSYMEDYIKRTTPKMKQNDGSLSLKGYGVRKQMFIQFNKDLQMMGKNVIYVAHEIERKNGDETIIRPEVGGSSANDLIKELDLVGYMESYGKERVIHFDPCDKFYAKNTCNMHGAIRIPVLLDENETSLAPNNFLQLVIENYHARLQSSKEDAARFEEICAKIDENVASIENAEDANNFVEWVKTANHIYNSKAIAQQKFAARVKELGLKFNKSTNTYSDNSDGKAA